MGHEEFDPAEDDLKRGLQHDHCLRKQQILFHGLTFVNRGVTCRGKNEEGQSARIMTHHPFAPHMVSLQASSPLYSLARRCP